METSIKKACALFHGAVVTFRSFKQSARRNLRSITEDEFVDAIRSLQEDHLGFVRSVQVPRAANPVTVFVKNAPDDISWPSNLCTQEEFRQRYQLPTHRSITPAIKRELVSLGCVSEDLFKDSD